MDAALVETDARSRQLAADGLAVVAIVVAGLTGVVTFLPAQGFIGAPLHDGLSALFGRLTFVLPLVLLLGGIVRLLHVTVPVARLSGLVLLLVGVLAAEHLVSAGDAGLAGRWVATLLRDAIGDVAAALLVLATLALGAMLTFGVRVGWRWR